MVVYLIFREDLPMSRKFMACFRKKITEETDVIENSHLNLN